MRTLSPGERTRAALIALSHRAPAVDALVLDEPTYSLDLVGQRAVTRVLREWPGGLVVASHDRTFLRGLANHVLELAGEEHDRPMTFGGSYVEYVERTGREAPGVHA